MYVKWRDSERQRETASDSERQRETERGVSGCAERDRERDRATDRQVSSCWLRWLDACVNSRTGKHKRQTNTMATHTSLLGTYGKHQIDLVQLVTRQGEYAAKGNIVTHTQTRLARCRSVSLTASTQENLQTMLKFHNMLLKVSLLQNSLMSK